MRYISARSVRFIFSQAFFGLRVRLLGHGRRVPPYEVVDREKNDRTDEPCCTSIQYTSVRQPTQFQCALPHDQLRGNVVRYLLLRLPGNGGPLAPRRMATSLALQIEAR
jgi:hypothetical protein